MIRKAPHIFWYIVGLLTLVVFFILDIILGSVTLPVGDVIQAILQSEGVDKSIEVIVWQFRLPKAITAVIVGASLSVAGLIMQTMFRNPLAGPFVLGISNGASLGVALLILAGVTGIGAGLGAWSVVLASVIGSGSVLLIVLSFSTKVRDSVTLLIIGLMVGSATGAIVSVLQFFSSAEVIQTYLVWTFGSLSGVTWSQMLILVPLAVLGLAITFLCQKQLNAFLLGEAYAKALGVSIEKYRIWFVIATCLLAGVVTAFCGPIAFVGLAVPHLVRGVLKTSNHIILLPAVIIGGANLMLICDLISQLPTQQQVLPINAVTALFGAPVVIWVVIKSKTIQSSY